MSRFSNKVLFLSIVAYIPIFGWFYPIFFSDDHHFAQFHGKQGFILSLYLFSSYLIYKLFHDVLFLSGFFHNLFELLMSLNVLLVLYASGVCVYNILRRKHKERLPFISEIAENFEV